MNTIIVTPTVGSFAFSLCNLLRQDGHYDPATPESAAALARMMPQWQQPERSMAYDVQLVQCWLEGSLLMPDAAWQGVRYYLASTGVPESRLDALQASRNEAEKAVVDKHPYAMSEARQAFVAKLQKQDMRLGEISGTSGRGVKSLSQYNTGTRPLSPDMCRCLDAVLSHTLPQQKPLTHIWWHERSSSAQHRWESAHSVGAKLKALAKSVNVTRKELSAKTGIHISTLVGGLGGGVLQKPSANFTRQQVTRMLDVIRQKQDAIAAEYPEAFIPLLTIENEENLYSTHEVETKGIKRRPASSVPIQLLPLLPQEASDVVMAAWALLQQSGASEQHAASLIGFKSSATLTAHVKQRFGNDYSDIPKSLRNEAEQWLRDNTIVFTGKSIATQLGATHKGAKAARITGIKPNQGRG